jgi:hypothetical protein
MLVTYDMEVGRPPFGLGGVAGTIVVHGDPEFARNNLNRNSRLVVANGSYKIDIVVRGESGEFVGGGIWPNQA